MPLRISLSSRLYPLRGLGASSHLVPTRRIKMRARLTISLLVGAALPLTALAQEHEHGGATEELGTVVFPVACNAAAQAGMHRAVAMLHSFWFPEARKAFEGVADADPGCGIAYWGVAMTQFGNPMAGGSTGPAQAAGWD